VPAVIGLPASALLNTGTVRENEAELVPSTYKAVNRILSPALMMGNSFIEEDEQ
jgi:hypothetical protein